MQVWGNDLLGFHVHMYPFSGLPARCHVEWEKGGAVVFLGTWVVRGAGDGAPLPDLLLAWLQSQEAYLWMLWEVLNP